MVIMNQKLERKLEKKLEKDFKTLSNKERAQKAKRFFKTNKGEYGEGDLFLGISNPDLRSLIKTYPSLGFQTLKPLLYSPYHEKRLFTALYLAEQFKHYSKKKTYQAEQRKTIYDFYLKHKEQMNNWDIIDTSAPHVVGAYLLTEKNRHILYKLASSNSLWDRRIAILSTWYFIRHHQFDDTLALAKILLNDKEDLMHKAVGWMLREIGKRDLKKEESFLQQNDYSNMPRTLLRYAIEKFEESKRKDYLNGRI